MKWKTKDGRVMEVQEMTDSHIKNAWAFLHRQLDFGVSDGQLEIFEAFKAELTHRHQYTLKLEIQFRDLGTRNTIHHVAEEMMDYDMHGYEYH